MYLGIDLGTSSVKSVLMDDAQQIIASHSAPMNVSRPHEGWSEQAPKDWIAAIEITLVALKAEQPDALSSVKGIGLSGHMHGATLLDASDRVLRPCMLWNDSRSASQAQRLDTDRSRELTGNILFPGFTAPKLDWVRENESDVFARVASVLLPKDYARLWLSGEHVSDPSDASGTGWLDVSLRTWSSELLDACQLTQSQMPRLVEGSEVSGTLRPELAARWGMTSTVVIAGSAGDNAASACGMGTVAPGTAFLSLGTSGVLFAANDAYRPNAKSAVHTFCHALPDTWHQMGVILAATDALNWLANITGQSPAALSNALDGHEVTPCEVIFLPYLGGERTPHNDAAARAAFIGMGHATDTKELTRAVLQGVAFAFQDSQEALKSAGTLLQRATAIGGGSRSRYWLQLLANIMNLPLDVCVDGDYGASLGAARLGMVAASGCDPLEVCTAPPIASSIEPEGADNLFEDAYQSYRQSYQDLKPSRNLLNVE